MANSELPLLRHKAAGFTLIELMIAVAVVAILVAIVAPSYQQQIRKSRRVDAKTALLDLASRQERYFSTHSTYTNTPANLGYAGAFPVAVPGGNQRNYDLTITAVTATTFSATASPVGDQVKDACGSYKLDQAGSQTNTGTLAANQCW